MSDGFVQISPDGSGKAIDNAVFMRDGVEIYRQRVETYSGNFVGHTADGRTRAADLTPLFDGKVLYSEDSELFTSGGTGTATWADQSVVLSVTAGQYMVRQSRQYFPYASGYPKVAEITFQDFQLVPGLIKRYGLFSSSAVAPFTANFDGWYVESNGDAGTYYLVVVNNGVEKLRLPWTSWSGYADVSGYNWENFTVTLTDFLWLGGAVLRTFLKTADGFVLAHQFDYSGSAKGVFMRSPNQPLRYEIRSTTGAGVFTTICSQVAIEGATSATGKTRTVYNPTPLATNTVGVTYALRGVRSLAAKREAGIRINSFGAAITTADSGVLLLLRNPTLSAPLTWATVGDFQEGTATNQTVSNLGWVVAAFPMNAAGQSQPVLNNSLAWLSSSLTDVPDEFILAYTALTTNQSVGGTISLTQY